jgi:hypothetical protein
LSSGLGAQGRFSQLVLFRGRLAPAAGAASPVMAADCVGRLWAVVKTWVWWPPSQEKDKTHAFCEKRRQWHGPRGSPKHDRRRRPVGATVLLRACLHHHNTASLSMHCSRISLQMSASIICLKVLAACGLRFVCALRPRSVPTASGPHTE